ncbi:MAG: protein phosphatase 2C domain-containing protein [Armatimonadetes bacterium]|nr:protein phosphatase 2C domain-containing protein [Armatimonadota bacterium]
MDSQDAARLPLEVAIQTHLGNVREVNEDNALADWWPDGSALLAVVADGMGGHSGGEVASKIAVEVLGELLSQPLPSDRKEIYEVLLERFYAADAAIREKSASDLSLLGMGTTLVAAIVTQSELIHLYAGDCRLYHFGQRDEVYVTADHTVMRVLLETGHITQDQVAQHPMRSVVTSCLGGGADSQLSVDPKWDDETAGGPAFRSLSAGDVLLLSSDGFHSQVDEGVPAQIAKEFRDDPQTLVDKAVQAALDAGGNDNVTAIVVKWAGEPQGEDEDSPRATGKLISARTASSDEPDATVEEAGSDVGPAEPAEDSMKGITEDRRQSESAEANSEARVQRRSFLSKLLHWRSRP